MAGGVVTLLGAPGVGDPFASYGGGYGATSASSAAADVLTGPRLSNYLATQLAASIFDESGGSRPGVIANSNRIIDGDQLGTRDPNQTLRLGLTADGSNISDWGKYSMPTIRGPLGDFAGLQVHFYYNPVMGLANYEYDYKAVSNLR
jgi:hypothetical protein